MSRKKIILAVILMTIASLPCAVFGAENCIAVANDLALNLSVVYQNVKYGTTLDFYANPYDPGGLYWKLNIATFHNLSNDPGNCIPVADDLSLSLCGTYQGKNYSFTLNFAPLPHDSAGLYWKMDINTFKVSGLPEPTPAGLVQPSDLQYIGAFRLPEQGGRPLTFAYGGNAMSFNPDGDLSNNDAYPGSLFVMGHDRLPYGDLPDGNQIAEVSIPVPVINSDPANLPEAVFIQPFRNALQGQFTDMEEIPKVGMQYLNHPDTGPKIHICWGQHLQPENAASHGWINANLTAPDFKGRWFIGNQNLYSVNGYMFDIPAAWADTHLAGRYLATGRMRDGGQGGMGPALFAYRPWLSGGADPASGTRLQEKTLLLYENADSTEEITRCMNGYQHADEWEGGAWITTPSGKSALLFAGTKATGTKYWYGFRNPNGPDSPCVDTHITDFTTCRNADGSRCPQENFSGCCDESMGNCISNRGWWSTRFDAQLILFDPADMAKVAAGTMDPWQPQPYTAIDIDEHLYFNPSGTDLAMIGEGVQRRYRIGSAAYDRNSGLLYVLELFVNEGKPVVHVWKVQ